jgi:anthranilate phosphoribosyltransferase
MLRQAIQKLVEGADLTEVEMAGAIESMMGEAVPASQVGAFLTAYRFKAETVDEMVGAARVLRGKAATLPYRGGNLIDTCGTGGDGRCTFNISTAAALVVAGAGQRVAKHGNRAISSRCGSADVLEALGVRVDLPSEAVAGCIEEVGIGFLYAPAVHSAMRRVAPIRRDLGFRTIFNLLGPLTNPAGVECQVVGVCRPELTGLMARALGRLGARRAMVVHGADGLDEVSISGPTLVAELSEGRVEEYELIPEEAGLARAPADLLAGGDAQANADLIRLILAGARGPHRDVVLLNAAVALYVAGACDTLPKGVRLAAHSIDSGLAGQKLEALAGYSQRVSSVSGECA